MIPGERFLLFVIPGERSETRNPEIPLIPAAVAESSLGCSTHQQSSRKPAKRVIRDPHLQSFRTARSADPESRNEMNHRWHGSAWFLDSGSRAPAKAGSLGRNDGRTLHSSLLTPHFLSVSFRVLPWPLQTLRGFSGFRSYPDSGHPERRRTASGMGSRICPSSSRRG